MAPSARVRAQDQRRECRYLGDFRELTQQHELRRIRLRAGLTRELHVAAVRAQLQRFGIAAGPLEQRYGAEGEGPSIYVTDPEGNVVELKGPPAAPLG